MLGKRVKNLKKKNEEKRQSKINTIRDAITSLSSLSTSIPELLVATGETEEALKDAVVTLEDLRDEQFPMALKAAPFINGALVIGSLFILNEIRKEI